MKAVLFLITIAMTATTWAVPTQMRLVSPSKLEVSKDGKELILSIRLKCSNDEALDWSQVVITYDDSGDQVQAVGIVLSESMCRKADKYKTYTTTVELDGSLSEDFEKMDIAR